RRLTGIDRLDARVRVGAAEHLAVQHPRQLDIRAIYRAPRYLIHPIRPHRPRPNHPILLCLHCHCSSPGMPLIRSSGSELRKCESTRKRETVSSRKREGSENGKSGGKGGLSPMGGPVLSVPFALSRGPAPRFAPPPSRF